MRLKYLTKMKIILCIFLLYITAVSVVGQSVELNGILGESVKFPAAVKKGGSLMHSGITIGDVTSGSFKPGKFKDRLHWDSSTGLFSISGLKMEDIGEYKVQNTDQNINTTFQLNVYKDNVPVSKPNVIIHYESCTIECTAERGTGVTLSWYREEKPYTTLPVESAPGLHLPVPVEGSGTYTCEAKNSVSNKNASITVGDHCTGPAGLSAGTIVPIIIAVVAVPIAVVFAVLYRRIKRKTRAIRTLIQVKEELDIMGPPADAVRGIIQVKKVLNDIVPPADDDDEQALIEGVKFLLNDKVSSAHGKTMPELSTDAVRILIQVKKLFDNVDSHAYELRGRAKRGRK